MDFTDVIISCNGDFVDILEEEVMLKLSLGDSDFFVSIIEVDIIQDGAPANTCNVERNCFIDFDCVLVGRNCDVLDLFINHDLAFSGNACTN